MGRLSEREREIIELVAHGLANLYGRGGGPASGITPVLELFDRRADAITDGR